jgi:hypothetical protein
MKTHSIVKERHFTDFVTDTKVYMIKRGSSPNIKGNDQPTDKTNQSNGD